MSGSEWQAMRAAAESDQTLSVFATKRESLPKSFQEGLEQLKLGGVPALTFITPIQVTFYRSAANMLLNRDGHRYERYR
jgi:hypothetical protein